ncbi:acetyl esterase/lipase [Methylohalomonas lacus]|uniref:Acetyl esterase/lipase n=1 Tax=Methylohalomonas lacus TaxID=398773 RepID=A0AAE3HLI8_9GAMM|nr:alpha/beta hydrolase [Methylohalomonas lacus]MCS3904551.1 acetyl esterase/lipase [Methylohalomonas lacus]
MNVRFTVLLAVLLLCSACVSHQGRSDGQTLPVADHDYAVFTEQTYSPADWPETLGADVYVPRGAGPFPAIMLVHGGGWREGRTRSDMNDIARRLARHGFVVVNISYRFAPEYRFPAQLHDLQQAMHWIHDNAGAYRIDSERIGGFGYSAGAHLVTLLATVSEGDELDQPHGGAETRLGAVVAGGLPSDLRKFDSGKLVRQFLGGVREEIFSVYAQASPVVHVSPDDPPMFLYHGSWDQLVPVDHARDMYSALQSADIDAELFIDHSRGHITMFLFDGDAVSAGTDFLVRQLPANERE